MAYRRVRLVIGIFQQTKREVANGDANHGDIECFCICFHLDVGDTFGTSKATVCRMVHRIANVVAVALKHFVKFERHADAERTNFGYAGFPNMHTNMYLH